MGNPLEKKKDLVLFEGSLKDYAEMLLKDRRGNGSVVSLGEIHEAVLKLKALKTGRKPRFESAKGVEPSIC